MSLSRFPPKIVEMPESEELLNDGAQWALLGCLGSCVFLVGAVGAPLYQAAFWLKDGYFPEVTLATLVGYPEQLLQNLAGWAGVQKLLLWFYDLHLSISLIMAAVAAVVVTAVLGRLGKIVSDLAKKAS